MSVCERGLQLPADLPDLDETEVPALGLLDVDLDVLHELEELVVVEALIAARLHAPVIGRWGGDLSETRADDSHAFW